MRTSPVAGRQQIARHILDTHKIQVVENLDRLPGLNRQIEVACRPARARACRVAGIGRLRAAKSSAQAERRQDRHVNVSPVHVISPRPLEEFNATRISHQSFAAAAIAAGRFAGGSNR